MQPLVYSTRDAEEEGIGWRRRGHDVAYYQNHIKRRSGYYYTLTFKLQVAHSGDVMYLAYAHPYTLSDLNRYIRSLETDPSTSKRFRRRPLCETLAGNTVHRDRGCTRHLWRAFADDGGHFFSTGGHAHDHHLRLDP